MVLLEPPEYVRLKCWLFENGGSFNAKTRFKYSEGGSRVTVAEDLPEDSVIVTCPFSLTITEELAQKNLSKLFLTEKAIGWNERQWISTYISFHWILSDTKPESLAHYEYIESLPAPTQLRTPLHFTPEELQAFHGSNLEGAAIDRKREWQKEWQQCQSVLAEQNSVWGNAFTWEHYLNAATYISSRAFPSGILSPTPTLQANSNTKPILLPGIDSLNHKRGQAVTWSVTYPTNNTDTDTDTNTSESETKTAEPTISLVLHTKASAGEEIFNNYGPKPNSELILGYGFSLPDNPDDTILLKIQDMRWEIGCEAKGAEKLWNDMLNIVTAQNKVETEGEGEDGDQDHDELEVFVNQLDTSAMLEDMVNELMKRLPSETAHLTAGLRPEVGTMLRDYIQGQRTILQSLLEYFKNKEAETDKLAREAGVLFRYM